MVDHDARRRDFPGWAVALVTMLVGAAILRNVLAGSTLASGALPLWSLALAAVWVGGGLVLVLRRRDDVGRPVVRSAGGSAVLTAVVAVAVSALCFAGAFVLLSLPLTEGAVAQALRAAASVPTFTTLVVALVTGLAEEVFFRIGLAGLCAGAMRWVVPNALYLLVTLASANLALILSAPILGLAATASRELTSRWWPPFVVHAAWTVAMIGVFPLVLA